MSSQTPNPPKSWFKSFRREKTENKTSSEGVKPVPNPAPVLSDASQMVYIRVRMANLESGRESTGHMYLIQGTFEDITRYAGATVDWVIKVAHLLCDPLGAGRIFTHASRAPDDWYNTDRDSSWQEVVRGNPLLPNIYEFVTSHPITLSKISARHSRSVTTRGPQTQANSDAFKRALSDRDGPCVVIGSKPSIGSHLIPRRLGQNGVTEIMERFAGATEAVGAHVYDPRIGINLFGTLDDWVDVYKVGFYHMAVSY
jgi:hypothetical protein